MAHSMFFKRFVRLLQEARRLNRQAANLPPPMTRQQWRQSRREFLKVTSVAASGALVTSTMPGMARYALAAQEDEPLRVAIVGGGLAGLNAAYQLHKVGIRADVYEAGQRLGGRVYSRADTVINGITLEYGGELINTDHNDMLALVKDFGLTLFDRRADAAGVSVPGAAYFFEGKSWSDAELVELLRPLVGQISHDAELLDANWEKYAPKFDRYSVADYLDQNSNLIPKPFVRALFEGVVRVEYGAEASESSSLQLLFTLPSVDGNSVELLGYSDETYTVQGGNSRIIDGLVGALGGQIHTGKALTRLDKAGKDSFKLSFKNGEDVEADIVIVAIPFSVLRFVEINLALPDKLKDFIKEVDLGRNEKVLGGFSERAWRQAGGFSLEAWTDFGCSEVWDGSQRQSDRPDGVLTYYLGGNETNALNNWPGGVTAAGTHYSQRLGALLPALQDKDTGVYSRSVWTRNQYTRGAYVNYKPGQLTRFGGYLWIESDNPAERQSVNVGKLVFAGEHLSDEYYGFMNGAAQTGRLAALQVRQWLKKKAALDVVSG